MSCKYSCIVCAKVIKQCHKDISCKICNCYAHKKCTQLKPKELKQLYKTEWICPKCCDRYDSDCSDTESENGNEFDIFEFDFEKFDKMVFNPARSESIVENDGELCQFNECSYVTPSQFKSDMCTHSNTFTILNVNKRNISKNFDKLKECIKKLTMILQ